MDGSVSKMGLFESVKRGIVMLLGHTATFYISAVLLGAPYFSQIAETLVFSLFLSVLCSIPLAVFCGVRYAHVIDLMAVDRPKKHEQSARFIAMLTIFGAWIGSATIPLDWERWWQAWPISNCIAMSAASLVGWIFTVTALKFRPSIMNRF